MKRTRYEWAELERRTWSVDTRKQWMNIVRREKRKFTERLDGFKRWRNCVERNRFSLALVRLEKAYAADKYRKLINHSTLLNADVRIEIVEPKKLLERTVSGPVDEQRIAMSTGQVFNRAKICDSATLHIAWQSQNNCRNTNNNNNNNQPFVFYRGMDTVQLRSRPLKPLSDVLWMERYLQAVDDHDSEERLRDYAYAELRDEQTQQLRRFVAHGKQSTLDSEDIQALQLYRSYKLTERESIRQCKLIIGSTKL